MAGQRYAGVLAEAARLASLTIDDPVRNHSAGWFALYDHGARTARVTNRHNIDIPPRRAGRRHHGLPDFLLCEAHKGGCDFNLIGYVISQSLCSRDGLCNCRRIVPNATGAKLRLPSFGHSTYPSQSAPYYH
jgi:hypothetical protein